MKIEKRTNLKVSVDKIRVGECFEYEDEIYIRLNENDEYLTDHGYGGVPVLRLYTGSIDYFDADGEKVLPVITKLVVDEKGE